MTTHDLKLWPEPYQAMIDPFRTSWQLAFPSNKYGLAKGDVVTFREWVPTTRHALQRGVARNSYTGRAFRCEVLQVAPFEVTLGLPEILSAEPRP